MKFLFASIFFLTSIFSFSQTWQDVGGGTNNSSHGMVVWNGQLINLGSFNNPYNRVAAWDGTNWSDLGGGVGIVARAGCVWNGNLVVVGDFWNNFQPCTGCNGVAVWDGISWTALDQGFNNDVLTCTVYNGDLIIGGDFTAANGVPINRVARWNETTQTFESMGGVLDMDNDVRCMTVFEGELWVGGDFNNIGGQGPLDGLVKWDETNDVWVGGNSGVDLIGGVNETVRVLYVNPNDGNLYMGGEFPELWDGDAPAEDFAMAGVAMYDGSNWYPLGTGLDDPSMQVPQAYCRAIHEYNGDLIVGGHFTTADGVPAQKIARWNTTTQTFSAMGGGFDGVGVDEYVKSAMSWNGIFFAGGAYTQAEGGPMNYIAQWYEAPTQAPTAAFTASNTNGCEGECIDFLDNSTNGPTSWNWTFPGSSTPNSTDQNPTNICFPTAGTYTVSLEACNGNGCNTTTQDITIGTAPTVTANDESICDGGSVTLTATPSSGGGDYLWSTAETTSSITVSPAATTTYTVEYTLNGCTSAQESVTVTVTVTPTVTANSEVICEGTSATLTATPSAGGGTYIWSPGGQTSATINVSPGSTTNYTVDYTLNGCTGSTSTSVTVNPVYNLNESISACENTTVTYPDGSTEVITASTSHTSTLSTTDGCDSIIVTSVTMNNSYNTSENVSVCSGTSYTYHDGFTETISGNTSHSSVLSTTNGCDSIIVTNVTAVTAYNSSENISVCPNQSVTYPDGATEVITASTSHTSTLLSVEGCDSIIVTNVAMNTAYNLNESVSVCENAIYTYPDGSSEVITGNTNHTSSLTSIEGCDSIIVTNVTMNTAYNMNESDVACENSTYTYPDGFTETITANSSHTSNLTSVAGCDSIVVTNVTMNPNFNTTESDMACNGSTYTYPDGFTETITGSTSHTSLLTASTGCDSTVVTNVSLFPDYSLTDNINVCSGATYTYPDGTISTNITVDENHTSILSTVNGCDSIIQTFVTVTTTFNVTENMNICSGANYTYPDGTVSNNITVDESHVSTLTSSIGCDSLVTTNLTVNANYNLSENASVCDGSVFIYPDGFSETITGNTSHTSNLSTVSGCDSIIVTNVTVNQAYSTNESISVCEGSVHVYPDGFSELITGSSSHTSALTSIDGCDSIIVTNVTAAPNFNQTENLDVCSGSTYVYPDGTVSSNITVNETHTSTLTSSDGCDSIIVTNLNINSVLNYTENIDLCSGSDYTYPDGTTSTNISANETHISNLISQNGCDSIITTNLNVNQIPTLTSNSETMCEGESVTLIATPSIGGGTFVWSPGGETTNSITVSPSSTTNYDVTYTLNGCSSPVSVSTVTVNPNPLNTISESNNVLTADQAGATYQWVDCNNGNQPITGETGQSFSPTANGSYAVEIDLNGCTEVSACTDITTIGIDEHELNSIAVYPNPVFDEIHISIENPVADNVSIKVYDSRGRVVLNKVHDLAQPITVSNLEAGAYIIELDEGELGRQRFVKQ
jgi:hypothetical protein